jgi:phosphohistidine phosphatase
MNLYLMQHGDALPKATDPNRPLSERGRADVERVAAFLKTAGVRISTIVQSGKLRATQTADLLSPAVGTETPSREIAGIAPSDSPAAFMEKAIPWTEETMVVGHQPFLGKLVSLLAADGEDAARVSFSPGTVVCMRPGPDGSWGIAWMICPELLNI